MKWVIGLFILVFILSACGNGATGGIALETAIDGSEEQRTDLAPVQPQSTGPIVPVSGSSGTSKFNVEIDLPETYTSISAGSDLWFTAKILNLANKERMDVTLTYQILDGNRQLQYSKSETVAVETQASFVAQLKAPKQLRDGLHYLRVHLTGPLGDAVSETTFNVVKEETKSQIVIKLSLFDLLVEIPEDYQTVSPGKDLLASVKMINIGTEGRIDVFLEYWITNENGKTILREAETVAVETQNNFIKTFKIPENTPKGSYTLNAQLDYPGLDFEPQFTTSFTVGEQNERKSLLAYGVSATGILGMLSILALFFMHLRFGNAKPSFEHLAMKRKVYKIVKKREEQ